MRPIRQMLSRPPRDEQEQGSGPAVSFNRRKSGLRMRDRVTTTLMWALLAASPVLSLMALDRAGAPAATAAETEPSPAGQELGAAAGPSGFAARFVVAWLSAGRGEEDQVQLFYPAMNSISREPSTQQATSATVVAAAQVQPGYWQVTAAAVLIARPDIDTGWTALGTQCFLVGVLVSDIAGQPSTYTASALPALVGCPSAGPTPAVDYGQDIPVLDGPLAQTISEFLGAYLTGVGELSRYTAPDVELAPVLPAPYVTVTVTGLRASTETDTEISEVPDEGTVLDVLVTVEALPAGGGVDELTYALSVTARDGRWELAGPPTIPALAAEQPPAEGDNE